MMRSIVQWLFIIAAASLVYFRKITEDGRLTLESLTYRSDFVFLAAVLLGGLHAALKLLAGKRSRHGRLEISAILAAWSYVAFASAATLFSIIVYDLRFDLRGYGNLFKTVLAVLVAVMVYGLLRHDGVFYRRLALALYVTPLIPAVIGLAFLLQPDRLAGIFGPEGSLPLMKPGDVRFQGLASNPFQVAVSNFVAVGFVWPISLHNAARGKWVPSAVGLVYMGCLAFFVFWSMTRAGVLLLLFALGFGGLAYAWCFKRHLRSSVVMLAAALLVLLFTWVAVPPDIAELVRARFAISDERPQIWSYYLGIAVAHPLGVGFNYEQRYLFDTVFQTGVNVHNGYLAAWLYGGVFGWLSILLFLWFILRLMRGKFKDGQPNDAAVYYIGAVTGFLGFWVLAAFLGLPLEDFTHAVLLALVLAGVPGVAARGHAAGLAPPRKGAAPVHG